MIFMGIFGEIIVGKKAQALSKKLLSVAYMAALSILALSYPTQAIPEDNSVGSSANASRTPTTPASPETEQDESNSPTKEMQNAKVGQVHAAPSTAKLPGEGQAYLAIQKTWAELAKGNGKQALQIITSALNKDKNNLNIRRYYAFTLVYNHSPQNAIEQLGLLARFPGYQVNAFDYCVEGDAYLEAGQLNQAEQAFKNATKIDANNDQANGGLLRVMAGEGRYDQALKLCSEAIGKRANDRSAKAYYQSIYTWIADAKSRAAQGASAARFSNLFQFSQRRLDSSPTADSCRKATRRMKRTSTVDRDFSHVDSPKKKVLA